MNGTMKKRIVSGLVVLGMVFSPAGAGIGAIPAFADTGIVSTNTENDPAGNEGESEGGETTPEGGETDPEGGETDPEGGETDPEGGETDPEGGETETDEGETSSEEDENDSAEVEYDYVDSFGNPIRVIDSSDMVFEKYGDDVLPYYGIPGIEYAEGSDFSKINYAVNAYTPSIYSSNDGYNGLNATEKNIYDILYSRASAIDNSTESYQMTGSIRYSDGKINTAYYFANDNGDGYAVFSSTGVSFNYVERAFNALCYDNPQFFWIGHAFTYGYIGDTNHIIALAFCTEVEEYATGSSRKAAKTALFKEVNSVVSGADAYANGYSAEWYIHDYLCRKTIYDPNLGNTSESPYDHDVTGLFLHGVCVCESYAKSTQLLINAVKSSCGYSDNELDVMYVVGMAYTGSGGGGHAWNQICLDGQWYNYDATWDDLPESFWDKYGQYYYKYFNVPDSAFTSEHKAFEDYVKIYSTHKCTATDYSYANHDVNFAEAKDLFYTVSVNGNVVKKSASVAAALNYISKQNNTRADYVIEYIGADSTITAATPLTVSGAKSVTFGGTKPYEFTGGFTANCDVIFETKATLGGNVNVPAKTLTVKSINSAKNNVSLAKDAVVDIKGLIFDGDYACLVDGGAKSIKIAAVTSTAGEFRNEFYIASADVEIGTITNTGMLSLYIEENAGVTVTGKVTNIGSDKVNLIPVKLVDGKFVTTEAANGTTMLTANTALASNFMSVFSVANEEAEVQHTYAVYKVGKEVKVTLPRVFVYIGEDDEEETYYGAYALFDEAVTAINADRSLNGKPVVIEISENVDSAKLALPSKVSSVTLASVGENTYTITVTGTASVTAPVDLIIDGVGITAKNSSGYTLTASKNLTINKYDLGNITALKGSAKGELTLNQMFGGCNITGFGVMTVNAGFDAGNAITVNVGTLVLNGCDFYVGKDAVSITVKDIKGNKAEDFDASISYAENAKPITITGNAYGTVIVHTYSSEGFTDGQKLFTAKTADMSVFKLNESDVPDDGYDYTLTRNVSNLCVAKVVFEVKTGEETLKFAKWADIISAINARNNKSAEYTVTFLDDVNIGGALTMPKAGTFGKLTITSKKPGDVLAFTGNITLTGETVLDNVCLVGLKKTKTGNNAVGYSISAGNYPLTVKGNMHDIPLVDFIDDVDDNAGILSITSKSVVNLILSNVHGNISAAELNATGSWIGGNVTVTKTADLSGIGIQGSLTANDIVIGDEAEEVEELSSAAMPRTGFTGQTVAATNSNVAGNLTAKNLLTLNESFTVKGAFSVAGIKAADDESVVLVLYQNKKPAAIGKLGFTDDSAQLKFALVDSDGLTVQITKANVVIATIAGKYANNLIPCDRNLDDGEKEVGYYIVKSGTNLIAKPKNGLMRVSINGKDAYYADMDSVIKDIAAINDPKAEYTIYFGENVNIPKLAMPAAKKYGLIVFAAEGDSATITTNSDLSLTGNFTLSNNVTINKVDSKDSSKILDMTVNAGAYRFFCDGKISYKDGASHFAKLSCSKKGQIVLNKNGVWEVSGSVSADELTLDGTLVLGDKATFTVTTFQTSVYNSTLKYPFKNAAKVKFGNIEDSRLTFVSTDNTDVQKGTHIANITGNLINTFKIGESSYYAVRSGSKLVAGDIRTAVLVRSKTTNRGCYYDTFENAMADITRMNVPTTEYEVWIAEDITVNKLAFPAAKKYAGIDLISRYGNSVTIKTASDLALTGDLTVDSNVDIVKTKNNVVSPININTGNYTLTCNGVLSDKAGKENNVGNISGKGKVQFSKDVNVTGSVNVGTFVVSTKVTLGKTSGFTCTTLVPADGSLVYTAQNAAKVKLGDIAVTNDRKTVTFPMLGEGVQLAAITGEFIDGYISLGESNNETYKVVRSGNKLIIKKIADAVTVTDSDDYRAYNRSYDSYDNAVADIARINNASGEYTICINADMTPKKFTLPAKGKYKTLRIVSNVSEGITIAVPSDITLTGNLIIGANVTLKKANGSTLKITAPRNSGFYATTEGTGKIEKGSGAIE